MNSKRTTKTKRHLAIALAEKNNLDLILAVALTDSFFETMKEFFLQDCDISIRKFANMRHVVRKEKIGQNIAKGTALHVPAKNTIKFMIADELEKKLNPR